MGAYLTRYRYLAHQEKIRKAIEAYKKRKIEKKEPRSHQHSERSRSITAEAIHSILDSEIDVENDGYYTKEERRKYELKLNTDEKVRTESFKWIRGELIGVGAFGKVFMAMNLDTGSLMAVKEVPLVDGAEIGENESLIRDVEREVWMLRQLKHPNIVRYIGTARGHNSLLVYMEYVPGGSIAKLLKRFGRFSERVVRAYTRQILEGVECLHRHGIMHRDIKGANILVDKNGECKVSDFGAARSLRQIRYSDGPPSLRGTPYWMAPEVIKQTGHGRQADIWSVGCTVLEMLTGKPPWSKFETISAALYHIAHTDDMPDVPSDFSPSATQFIHACLQRDPRKRPSATTILMNYEFVFPLTSVKKDSDTKCITTSSPDTTHTTRPTHLIDSQVGTPDSKKRDKGSFSEIGAAKHSLASRRGFPIPFLNNRNVQFHIPPSDSGSGGSESVFRNLPFRSQNNTLNAGESKHRDASDVSPQPFCEAPSVPWGDVHHKESDGKGDDFINRTSAGARSSVGSTGLSSAPCDTKEETESVPAPKTRLPQEDRPKGRIPLLLNAEKQKVRAAPQDKDNLVGNIALRFDKDPATREMISSYLEHHSITKFAKAQNDSNNGIQNSEKPPLSGTETKAIRIIQRKEDENDS
eukprot:CAMPEP_0184498358 /NCGR_PEP_ID=MMETSP0113_2-20130426/38731_1 /TAXON_ID=91329 /ORGANISM="Norrisiella sphaerica, Strain BC52" /LENGTH=638 /DNA_ID=CAMNT_0026885825 /DNA_START=74 /DNA_END=1990 /DNA_ORIENTATION=-